MEKVLVVYGTRPEAIKMAPVVTALQRSEVLEPVVAVTGQHREMLDQVNTLFGIEPSHDLDILTQRQGLDPIDPEILEIAKQTFAAARRGDVETLTAYVDAGVPVNLTNETGDTLLMLASYHGHAEAVQALVERGADVNRLNDRGQSPLAGAVFKGVEAVVRALAEAGADPRHGHPTAEDTAKMFGRDDYLELWQR